MWVEEDMAVDGDLCYAEEDVAYTGTEAAVDTCAVVATVAERWPKECVPVERIE